MEKNQLIYVLEVAKCGNITRAAENLHISQPSLSNQIIQLEKELGIFLFERSKKKIYLTDAGETFVRKATPLIQDFNNLKQLMSEFAQQKHGHLRVGAFSVMCALKIPEAIQAFAAQHQNIDIMIVEDGSVALLRALKEKRIDAAFVVADSATLADNTYCATHIFSSNVVVGVPSHWEESHLPFITFSQLSVLPLIITSEEFNLASIVLSHLDANNVPYKVKNICNQIDSTYFLASKGMGAIISTPEVAKYYHYPNLSFVPLRPVITRDIHLVHRKNLQYHPLLNSFATEIITYFKQANNFSVV